MTTPSKASQRMVPADQPEHRDVSGGNFMCRCGWPGIGQAGTPETFAAHLAETKSGYNDDHTADQCRFETCESCGCCAHGKAHVIGCSTEDAPVGFSCPNDDCGCTGQGRAHAARPATPGDPATPPVGAGTSEGATGPQIGAGEPGPDPDGGVEMTDGEWRTFRGEAPAGGLGDAIRAIIPATYTDDGYFGVTAVEIGEFADRADALERDRDEWEAKFRQAHADHHRSAQAGWDMQVRAETAEAQVARVQAIAALDTTPLLTANQLRGALDGAR
jgi:hypothetical protein